MSDGWTKTKVLMGAVGLIVAIATPEIRQCVGLDAGSCPFRKISPLYKPQSARQKIISQPDRQTTAKPTPDLPPEIFEPTAPADPTPLPTPSSEPAAPTPQEMPEETIEPPPIEPNSELFPTPAATPTPEETIESPIEPNSETTTSPPIETPAAPTLKKARSPIPQPAP